MPSHPRRPRRRRRTQKIFTWLYAAGAAAVVLVMVTAVVLPGAGGGPAFPFPCTTDQATVLHTHPYLRIRVLGQNVTIPANIGITANCQEPLNTRDGSGIIHLEAPAATDPYTLGDFFRIWADTYRTVEIAGQARPVQYTKTDLFGYRGGHITLLVDGKASSAGPGLVLNDLDYCSAADTTPPCAPTAASDPLPAATTGHTIVLTYSR